MSRVLRVGFDVGPLHGHRTGIGHAVAAMRDAITDDGAVEILPYLVSTRAQLEPGEQRLPIPAALAHRLWARSPYPRFDRWFGSVDVVHGTNYVVPPSAFPRVVSVYDCWFLEHRELANPAVRRAGDVLRQAVGLGAHVHTSSDATASKVRRLLGTDRVTTVHLAPLEVRPAPATAPIAGLPTHPYIVSIGTEERRKNLPRLVEAYGIAVRQGLEHPLVFAGAPGDDTDATTAAIRRLPSRARQRVFRLGAIGDATKWWLLRHADVMAYPSIDEGFGFPVLDAQTVEIPVVGGDAGSIPEVGGDGVELVDPADPASIATGLLHVTGDDTHRKRLIELGTENLRRFSWGATAAGLRDVYRRCIEEHQP